MELEEIAPHVRPAERKLDVAALEFSLLTVALRHETLRTTFDLIEGRPVQIVRQEPPSSSRRWRF